MKIIKTNLSHPTELAYFIDDSNPRFASLHLDEETTKKLLKLKDYLDVETNSDILMRALVLLSLCAEKEKLGHPIFCIENGQINQIQIYLKKEDM